MQNKMTVSLGINSYDIHIKRGILKQCGGLIRGVAKGKRVHVLTDHHVAPLYAEAVTDSLKEAGFEVTLQVLPAGERTKQLPYLSKVWSGMSEAGITRSDLLVTLGGGVIGDLGGFAAATFLRGISFVQIPTSLLAQVDSSVGGKVAIDLPEGKNMAGNFYQPKLVIIDPVVLDTLSDEQFSDGMGEVIKYGLFRSRSLFDMLKKAGSREKLRPVMEQVICECIDIKRVVVENDERDTGDRMLLNFGHTLAHAIERAQNYEGLSHGAAVGVGMHLITRLSEKKQLTRPGTANEIESILSTYGMPTNVDRSLWDGMLPAIAKDKKNLGKTLNVILITEIGDGFIYPTDASFLMDAESLLLS